MTTRLTILAFVLSFAAITGWLINREPAEHTVPEGPPTPVAINHEVNTPAVPTENITTSAEVIALSDAAQSVRKHLNQLVIPQIDIENATLEEAIDSFRMITDDISSTRLSYIIRNPHFVALDINDAEFEPDTRPQGASKSTITLLANNITATQGLDLICEKAGYRWNITEHAVVITPLD